MNSGVRDGYALDRLTVMLEDGEWGLEGSNRTRVLQALTWLYGRIQRRREQRERRGGNFSLFFA